MNYSKNEDHYHRPRHDVVGIQYSVIDDLDIEPVDIDFFKAHARIDFNVDDKLITFYIRAARQALEEWAQLSFGRKRIRLMALNLPHNYRLMYGPVDEVEDAEHFGDILTRGGKVDVTFTTKEGTTDNVKAAIARYAAGLYAVRENILTDSKGNPVNG